MNFQVSSSSVSPPGKWWREERWQLGGGCLQRGRKQFASMSSFVSLNQENKSSTVIVLVSLTHCRIQRLLEEVLPTLLGRTDWTKVVYWRRMHPWVPPPSPPPAAHLPPSLKRLIWWVIWVIIAVWSNHFWGCSSIFRILKTCKTPMRQKTIRDLVL